MPNKAVAEAIAEEWRGQGARIDPATMPLTRLANSVIDGVQGHEEAAIATSSTMPAPTSSAIAPKPQGPRDAQTKHWDPIVAWAKRISAFPCVLPKA